MIFVKLLTTIFLLLQGTSVPTLYGGFQGVEIADNTEMSLYIDYADLYEEDTLTFSIEFVDTALNVMKYNDNFSFVFDAFALIQQTSGTILENLPLFAFFLNSENSVLRIPYLEVCMYLIDSDSNAYELYISYYEEESLYANNMKTETYLTESFTPQILDEYFRSFSEDFGGSYASSIDSTYANFYYVPDFELTIPFVFTNDLFFNYTIADYMNSYQAYTSISDYDEIIYNKGYQEGLTADMSQSAIFQQGFNAGKTEGYQEGLRQGSLNCEGSTAPLANVFGIFESAAMSLVSIFSIPIMPGITLGTLIGVFVGIPLLLLLLKHLGK